MYDMGRWGRERGAPTGKMKGGIREILIGSMGAGQRVIGESECA